MDNDILAGIESILDKPEDAIDATNQTETIVPSTGEPKEEIIAAAAEAAQPSSFLSSLKDSGYEFGSEAEVIAAFKELNGVKDQYNQFSSKAQDLEDEEVKALLAFKRSGGDAREYFELKSKDYNAVSGKEILWEKWKIDNKEDLADPDFAKRKFEREITAKYTIKKPTNFIDEDEEREWESANQEDIEFRDMLRKSEESKAKKYLEDRKSKIVAELPTPTGKSDQDAGQALADYQTGINNAIQAYKPIQIQISDNEGESFKLALSDDLRKEVESARTNPELLLSAIGFNSDGSIDSKAAIEALVILKSFKNGKLGKLMSEHVLNVRNIETIERKQINPKDTKENVSSANEDDWVGNVRRLNLFPQ